MNNQYQANVKLLFIGASLLLGLWFAHEIVGILFLFFLAVVLTLILNAPTMWLVSKGVPRTAAALLVFLTMLLFLFLVGWLIIPKVLEQVSVLITNLPAHYQGLKNQLFAQLHEYPALRKRLLADSDIANGLPSAMSVISRIGNFSFSLIGGIFLLVMFFSIVIYMLITPAPLLETYLTFFSEAKRPQAAQALARASNMVVGWMWSNLIVGIMEAIAVYFFLSYTGLPGVWVWTGLALFAEMVPKLGLYIMAIPPTLVALSVDPVTALWVLVFYLLLNEIMGDFVVPRVRASTMNLHPVSSLFVMLAMGAAFGLIGALIATPLTAFIKAYYEEFYLSGISKGNIKKEINVILERRV